MIQDLLGWCLFIELNILCTHDAFKLLFVSLWNVHFALVLQTSYVLIFPHISKKQFSFQIRPFLSREHFWSAFQEKESPGCTPVLREEEAGHWCLCHDRRIGCGKEASVAFLSKEALGVVSVYWGECMKQSCCLKSRFLVLFQRPFFPVYTN